MKTFDRVSPYLVMRGRDGRSWARRCESCWIVVMNAVSHRPAPTGCCFLSMNLMFADGGILVWLTAVYPS